MPLTVLTDSDVRTLLLSLTRDDILDLQQSLADALHYYSTSTEEDHNGCCSSYQPLRTALKRSDGQTTLFMPASSNDGLGVKIVTLSDPSKSSKKSADDSSLTSLESLSLSQQSSVQSTTPRGSLTLLDRHGTPRALINAEEITAFRTALASTMLLKKRKNVHDVVVFGAGKQAYWHIRLALLLRGPEIHHLNIINRSFERAQDLLVSLYKPDPSFPSAAELAHPKIQIITPAHTEYERLLKSTIRASSVILCTTPSTTPLFPHTYLTNPEGRKKGRYVAAIGSYKPHMVEIHPEILRQNVSADHQGGHHHHRHAKQGGAVIVDSVEACLQEAGEVIQAQLTGNQVVEIGELFMLKRDAELRRREAKAQAAAAAGKSPHDSAHELELDTSGVEIGEAKTGKKKNKNKKGGNAAQDEDEEDKMNKSLMEWLQKGNVIYKSVGLGLMDVVVGSDLVRMADTRGVGTRIEGF